MGNLIVIEIDDGKNRSVLFPPANEMLRGRFARTNMHAGAEVGIKELNQLPEIPGIHVFADLDERSVGYYDPLAFGRNKPVLEKVKLFGKAAERVDYKPVVGKKFTKVSDEQFTTWLYAMWSFVKKAKVANLVSGEFPVIKGRAMTNPYDWTNKGQNKWSNVDTEEEELLGYDEATTTEYEPTADPVAA